MKKPPKKNNIRFIFFGTAPLADDVLAELAKAEFVPERIIESTHITPELLGELGSEKWDVFIVASYGKKIPKELLDMPRRGVVNVHPSLLPRLRGPSPIRSTILHDERETGVSIMLLDEELDHGPLIAQKKVVAPEWPTRGKELDRLLAKEGGALLVQVLPAWLKGDIEARPQNHDLATYCTAFKKGDGLINLSDDAMPTGRQARANLLKIRAFEGWPGAYTFFERNGKRIRVQILDAHLDSKGALVIDKVKPEGKREMTYEEFLRGLPVRDRLTASDVAQAGTQTGGGRAI